MVAVTEAPPVATHEPCASDDPSSKSSGRIAFVGHMVGRQPGRVTTQGQVLSDLFRREGYSALDVSPALNPYVWLMDVVRTLITQRKTFDVLFIEVYGGRSFIVEDLASRLGRLFGRPIVMALHGGAMPDFMASYPRWANRVLNRANALVVPSTFLQRALEDHGFRAQVVPNVVDVHIYPYRHRRVLKPRLLWMRTFESDLQPADGASRARPVTAAYARCQPRHGGTEQRAGVADAPAGGTARHRRLRPIRRISGTRAEDSGGRSG